MTTESAPPRPESSRTWDSWRLSIAPAVLLLGQAGLFIWMSPRGFELTDESFYLLNDLYWRDLTATVSFFGAYFELPFRLLGQSISIRIVALLGLAVASAFFARQGLRFSRRREAGDSVR